MHTPSPDLHVHMYADGVITDELHAAVRGGVCIARLVGEHVGRCMLTT